MAANLGQEESRAGTRSRLGDVRLLCLRPPHVEYCCFGKPCYEHVSGCHLVMQPDREVRGIVQEIEKKKHRQTIRVARRWVVCLACHFSSRGVASGDGRWNREGVRGGEGKRYPPMGSGHAAKATMAADGQSNSPRLARAWTSFVNQFFDLPNVLSPSPILALRFCPFFVPSSQLRQQQHRP